MGLFHHRSRWERLVDPLKSAEPQSLVKTALATAATFVTVTVASAVVSSIRRPKDDQ
jgi:hypothetical protein